jgi:probable rRNA maturation factor
MSPGDSTVLFRALPSAIRLSATEKRLVRQFASALAASVAESRPFTCLIADDQELSELNRQFLAHDYATDVLSFPSEPGCAELGEVAISAERAQAQADAFGHERTDEIRILMLHGLLHLMGFDHERDRGEMARAEAAWRRHFELPETLIGRTKLRKPNSTKAASSTRLRRSAEASR